MAQHRDQHLLWHYCQWMTALCVKIRKQRLGERVHEGINECVVGEVEERQSPFVVIQLHFDLFWCPGHVEYGGRWRHRPELSLPEAQSPESVLRPCSRLSVPRYRQRGHTQEPVLIASCFHDPLVTSWTQLGHAKHLGADVEALWVVGATPALLCVMKGSQVVWQDEAGVCCVWVKCHRSWKRQEMCLIKKD